MNRFDRETGRFTHFKNNPLDKQSLSNNTAYSVFQDKNKTLWVGTSNGINRFDRKSGEMFFGGLNGLNAFYPDEIKENQFIPEVVITGFRIFNKEIEAGEEHDGEIILKKSIIITDTIVLSYKDYVFSFEFSALHYSMPEKNQYAYMMERFDKDWTYTGTRRFATYTNLEPGSYVFRVKG